MTYRSALFFIGLLAFILNPIPAQAQYQVTAEAWIDDMLDSVPEFFCQNDQYFIQCFEVTQTECMTVSKQEAERCLGEIAEQLPAQLNMPDDGRKWGSDVGQCAGIGYDRQLADRKDDSPRCNPQG